MELAAVNAELEVFDRTAAHDLKSPLNGIIGFCHLMRSNNGTTLSEDGLRMLGHIEGSARRMSAFVDDLLMLSRVPDRDLGEGG